MADPISLDAAKKTLAKVPAGVDAPDCSVARGKLLLTYASAEQYAARVSADVEALRKAGATGASECDHPKGGAFAIVSISL